MRLHLLGFVTITLGISLVLILASCPKEEPKRGATVPKLDGCSFTGQDGTNYYFDCWKKR